MAVEKIAAIVFPPNYLSLSPSPCLCLAWRGPRWQEAAERNSRKENRERENWEREDIFPVVNN